MAGGWIWPCFHPDNVARRCRDGTFQQHLKRDGAIAGGNMTDLQAINRLPRRPDQPARPYIGGNQVDPRTLRGGHHRKESAGQPVQQLMDRAKTVNVPGSLTAHARAESRDPYRKLCRRSQPLRLRLRAFVCVDELVRPGLQLFGDRTGRCPRDARGADQEELLEVSAPAREIEHVSRSLHVRGMEIGRRRREPRLRGGVNDDADIAHQAVPFTCAEAKVRVENVAADRHQTLEGGTAFAVGCKLVDRGSQRAEAISPPAAGPQQDKDTWGPIPPQQLGQQVRPQRPACPRHEHGSVHVNAPTGERTNWTRSHT